MAVSTRSCFPKSNGKCTIFSFNRPGPEGVALELAEKAGIEVANGRVEKVGKKPILIVQRFDTAGAVCIPFCRPGVCWGEDKETRSYLALFFVFYRNPGAAPGLSQVEREYIRNGGAQPEEKKGLSNRPERGLPASV